MSQPLTTSQKKKINDALELVSKILDCFDELVQVGKVKPDPEAAELKSNLDVLHSMMYSDRIDVDSKSNGSVIAWADGDGIHFNDQSPAFPLGPAGDEFPISSAWLIIQTLLHEKFHILNHTGLTGILRKAIGMFGIFGLLVLKIGGVHEGSLLWHEYTAYWHAYRMLGVLDRALFWVCLKKPDCISDCEEHKRQVEDARNKQKPY